MAQVVETTARMKNLDPGGALTRGGTFTIWSGIVSTTPRSTVTNAAVEVSTHEIQEAE
jgi:hypothetical protein